MITVSDKCFFCGVLLEKAWYGFGFRGHALDLCSKCHDELVIAARNFLSGPHGKLESEKRINRDNA